MANTKISQLPPYTGSAADLRWFVMNNSGETETFKYSGYSSPYVWNNSTSGITEVNITKSTQINTRGGTNTETADSYGNFVVGNSNTVGNSSKRQFIFGDGNTATVGVGVGFDTGAFIFGQGNSSTSAAARFCTIFGVFSTVNGSNSACFGDGNNVDGIVSFAMGKGLTVSSSNSFASGESNALTAGNYQYSFGEDNDITTSSFSGIFGGLKNRITGSGNRNVILGSSASTINNLSDVVILGLNGFSATTSATTYVDNLQVLNKIVLINFVSLDFANDAAADAGGVPLGGIYHHNGSVKVRIT